MNYLAHFLLSADNADLIVGNFIADDVKGKKYLQYPKGIQNGIIMHRAIDDFTDSHPVVGQSKKLIRKHQQKFTPVVMDILYDYFLATNFHHYSQEGLLPFSKQIYQILNSRFDILTPKTKYILHYMQKNNWLYNYSTVDGIKRALTGMSQRTPYQNNMHVAHHLLNDFHEELLDDFKVFYPELHQFVKNIENKSFNFS